MIIKDEDIKQILVESKVIAIAGCSATPHKAAHEIPRIMQSLGYKIIPVNPNAEEILGEKCYKHILDVKEKVDIVQIFRPSSEIMVIVQDILKMNPLPKTIWTQLGIIDEKAALLAEKEGVKVVMDKCLMVEHGRLLEN